LAPCQTQRSIQAAQQRLLAAVKQTPLPSNPLDDIIERLRRARGRDAVAELTGRKGQLELGKDGGLVYTKRTAAYDKPASVNVNERTCGHRRGTCAASALCC
jgi:hypothetical protein